jgi:hypothetical protein
LIDCSVPGATIAVATTFAPCVTLTLASAELVFATTTAKLKPWYRPPLDVTVGKYSHPI